jgi:exopolyphosphatase/guanosine-5'-triphosphate,3'-diphosphate pyrophosphatase
MEVLSIPLGAAVFSQQYMPTDPPGAGAIAQLEKNVDALLHHALLPWVRFLKEPWILAGTGGTVTTLAAMIHGIDTPDIHPTMINGLKIDKDTLSDLIDRLKEMTLEERAAEKGLDKERAPVILAGAVIVEKILHYFQCPQLVASFSDILDGMIMDQLNTLV